MRPLIVAYFGCLAAFVALDAIWLGVIAPEFYRAQLGHLLAAEPRLGVAAAFYAMFLAGLVYFAVRPALRHGGWTAAALNGGLFGFFTYLTYELTNMATLPDWPLLVVVVDVAWGVFLNAFAASVGYRCARGLRDA